MGKNGGRSCWMIAADFLYREKNYSHMSPDRH